MAFILKLFGTKFSAILLLILLATVLAGGVFYKIDSLNRDKRELALKNANKELTEQARLKTERIAVLEVEAAQYASRVARITEEYDALNRRMGQNAARRDTTSREIAPPVTPTTTTKDLEQRANGMNDMFRDMARFGVNK